MLYIADADRYAMERSQTYFKVWFWARNDYDVPSDVAHARSFVDPDAWVGAFIYLWSAWVLICKQGTPAAYFPNTFCDFSTHFDPQNIIINLTLCKSLPRAGNDDYKRPCVGGDWAGSTYSQGTGCPLTCVGEFLPNPPAATRWLKFILKTTSITMHPRLLTRTLTSPRFVCTRTLGKTIIAGKGNHFGRFNSFVVDWDSSCYCKLFENQLCLTSRPARCHLYIHMNSRNICPLPYLERLNM